MDAALQSNQLITVFGGSGFLGRYVVRALAKKGWRVRVAVRRPDLAGHLQPMGNVGQIHTVQANLRYPDSITRAVEGADAVVNLVGILHETGGQNFSAVHVFGAGAIANCVRNAGIDRLVQISAIGADANSDANYARTKSQGEEVVRGELPDAIILRPSVVFGPEDQFFNRFASLARILPVLPLSGGGKTRFQPVYVGDLAQAVVRVLDTEQAWGVSYELGGPDIMSFREVLEFILDTTERKRLLVPLPFPIARFQAAFLQQLPKPMLTIDQVRLLENDNVVSDGAIKENRTLAGIGITAQSVRAIVPKYLERFRKTGQFRVSAV